MRGYKRPQSVLNVSRLIAWAGNLLAGEEGRCAHWCLRPQPVPDCEQTHKSISFRFGIA